MSEPLEDTVSIVSDLSKGLIFGSWVVSRGRDLQGSVMGRSSHRAKKYGVRILLDEPQNPSASRPGEIPPRLGVRLGT